MATREATGELSTKGAGTWRMSRAANVARAWTLRTVRARYQQSALGWTWAVVQPVATVAIFTLVFTRVVHVDTGGVPYVVFSYAAVVPWTLLSSAVPDMSTSLVNNMSLVTKIYFPREALPVAALAARLFDFGVSAVLLLVLVVAYGTPVSLAAMLFLPVILLVQVLLVLGLGLGAAALNVFYRDVDPVLKLVLQVWFYASPVIYPVAMVPARWRTLYFLNPMAGLIESYRDVLIGGQLPGAYFSGAAVVSVAVLLTGYGVFRRAEGRFADVI